MNVWLAADAPFAHLLHRVSQNGISNLREAVIDTLHEFRGFINSHHGLADADRNRAILLCLSSDRLIFSRYAALAKILLDRGNFYSRRTRRFCNQAQSKFIEKATNALDVIVEFVRRLEENVPVLGNEVVDTVTGHTINDYASYILYGIDYTYRRVAQQNIDLHTVASALIPVPPLNRDVPLRFDIDTTIEYPKVGHRRWQEVYPLAYTDKGKDKLPSRIAGQLFNCPAFRNMRQNYNCFRDLSRKIIAHKFGPTVHVVEAGTGTGKTGFLPGLLSSEGMVMVVVHHRLHGRRLAATVNRLLPGTEQAVFIDGENMYSYDPTERERLRGGDSEWRSFVPLSVAREQGKLLVIVTYDLASKYFLTEQFPSFCILDDAYEVSEGKTFFAHCLREKIGQITDKTKIIAMSAPTANTFSEFQGMMQGFGFQLYSNLPLRGPYGIYDAVGLTEGCYLSLFREFEEPLEPGEEMVLRMEHHHSYIEIFNNQLNIDTIRALFEEIMQGQHTLFGALNRFRGLRGKLTGVDEFPNAVNRLARFRGNPRREAVIDVVELYLLCSYADRTRNPGGILIFVPFADEAFRLQTKIRELQMELNIPALEIIVITERGESDQIYNASVELHRTPNNLWTPRIVISDSVGETSVTILGISVVIDSNLVGKTVVDRTGTSVLRLEEASATVRNQRRGRTGRSNPGVYYNLMQGTMGLGLTIDSLPFGDMKKRCLLFYEYHLSHKEAVTSIALVNLLERHFPTRRIGGQRGIDWELTVSALLEQGCLVIAADIVEFTDIGSLIVHLPGTFLQNYTVALGTLCGVSRNTIAYSVISEEASRIEQVNTGSVLERWTDFFRNTGRDRFYTHDFAQCVVDIAYALQRNPNEVCVALSMGIDHHLARRWRLKMRSYEQVIRHFVNMKLGVFDPNKYSTSTAVTVFAIAAASGENLEIIDERRHQSITLYNRFLRVGNEEEDNMYEERFQHVNVFVQLVEGVDDEVIGKTGVPATMVALAREVFTMNDNEMESYGRSFFVGIVGFVCPDDIDFLIKARQGLRQAYRRAVSYGLVDEIFKCVDVIAEFYNNPQCPDYHQFGEYDQQSIDLHVTTYEPAQAAARSTLDLPPIGTQQRKLWCVNCMAQGHAFQHCLTSDMEAQKKKITYNFCSF